MKISRLALLLLLFGCGRVGKEQIEDIKEVTLWETYGPEERKELLKIKDEFERKNPGIRINVQSVPWPGHQSKLMTSMITNTAPDIARVDVAFLPRLVASNSVKELTQYGEINIEDYIPAAINSNVFDGKVYGLPDQTTGVTLFYNKEHFKEAGIESPPKTWAEFIKTAQKLTRDIDGDGKIDRFGFAMNSSLWWSFPFFNTFGAKFISEDGKRCLLNSPAGYDALQLMVNLYHKYKVEAGAWRAGSIDPDTGFLNDVYSMIFTGPWNVKRFKEANLNFGIALIPAGPAGTSTNVGGTNMVVLRKARHPEIAFKFLKYLTSPEVQAGWSTNLSQIPVNVKSAQYIDFSEEVEVFFQQMKTSVARPKVISYTELESIVNPYIYAALAGRMTPQKAIDTIAEKIEEEILLKE